MNQFKISYRIIFILKIFNLLHKIHMCFKRMKKQYVELKNNNKCMNFKKNNS